MCFHTISSTGWALTATPILSYLNHGVNEHTLPKDIHDHWQSYREKAAHPEHMLLYGHGDGGGGVTREMLEYVDRADLMVGQPASRYSTAGAFFAGIEKEQPVLPKWHGDLYLELHRGTYTTHARNKRNNRKAEVLYREAELWNTLALPDMEANAEAEVRSNLHEGWKLILLNQFHDIIPGSAIVGRGSRPDPSARRGHQHVRRRAPPGAGHSLTRSASAAPRACSVAVKDAVRRTWTTMSPTVISITSWTGASRLSGRGRPPHRTAARRPRESVAVPGWSCAAWT